MWGKICDKFGMIGSELFWLLSSKIFSEPKICAFDVLFSSVKQPQQASKTQRGSLFGFPPPFQFEREPKGCRIQDIHQSDPDDYMETINA